MLSVWKFLQTQTYIVANWRLSIKHKDISNHHEKRKSLSEHRPLRDLNSSVVKIQDPLYREIENHRSDQRPSKIRWK